MLKKTRINIEINAEQLKAIKVYEKDQDNDLGKVLNETISKYYKAVVPQEVQFYIETQKKEAENKLKKRQNKKLAK